MCFGFPYKGFVNFDFFCNDIFIDRNIVACKATGAQGASAAAAVGANFRAAMGLVISQRKELDRRDSDGKCRKTNNVQYL